MLNGNLIQFDQSFRLRDALLNLAVRIKRFVPDALLIASNSMQLNLGLCNVSHTPRYEMVSFRRIQFWITILVRSELSPAFTISVKQIYPSSCTPKITAISESPIFIWLPRSFAFAQDDTKGIIQKIPTTFVGCGE